MIFIFHIFSQLDLFDCASKIGCGSEGWIILDASLNVYVKNATCNDATPFSSLTELNCECPVASIGPCSCQPTAGSNATLTISCENQNLDDAAMKAIIDNVPPTTPVDTFDFSQNQLTAVPTGLTQYATLVSVTVASNSITSIGSNDLSLTGNVLLIDLSFNKISVIAPGSLPGTITFICSSISSFARDLLNFTIFKLSKLQLGGRCN